MHHYVSVPSEPRSPKNSPVTPPPSVSITSLKKAMEVVNAQESLSTEDLFKTLLTYHKPDQGMFATRRDPQFLNEAINKGASSQGIVSDETQKEIALAIRSEQFGTRIPENVALAIVYKLHTFTDPTAQRHISGAIVERKFGTPIPEAVARAIAAKLATFTDPEAQRDIAAAILEGKFGTPIPEAVALAIAAKLDAFTDPEAQRYIAMDIRTRSTRSFGTPIPEAVALAIADKLDKFTNPGAQGDIASAILEGKFGTPIPESVALAIAAKLATFTDPIWQTSISAAILGGKFGTPIPEAVALVIVSKLATFTDTGWQRNIALAIRTGRFGTPIQQDVALAIADKLATFTDRVSRRDIAWAIKSGKVADTLTADEKTTRAELNRRLATPQFVELLTGVGDEGVLGGYVLPLISAHFKSLAPATSPMEKLASQLDFAAEIECEEAPIPMEKIKNRLATPDREVVIPYGMDEHDMLLKLKFTDKGLNVEIYNSGEGLQRYHDHKNKP